MFVRLSKTKAIKKRQRQWQIISSSIVIFLRAPNFPPTKFRQTSSTWQELLQQKKSIFPLPFWPYCIHQNIKWISPCNLQKQGKRICPWKTKKETFWQPGSGIEFGTLGQWGGIIFTSAGPLVQIFHCNNCTKTILQNKIISDVRLFKYFTATIVLQQIFTNTFHIRRSACSNKCTKTILQPFYKKITYIYPSACSNTNYIGCCSKI